MSSTLFQIQIPKRSKVCKSCDEPLKAGMDYFSYLLEIEKDYERQDFCTTCFPTQELSSSKYWKSKVPVKKVAVEIPKTKNEQIFAYLKSSLEKDSILDQKTSFVLSIFLARKRFMALRKEVRQEDQSIMQIYEIPETEEMILVKKMQISSLQIEEIQLQIASHLRGN